MASSNSTFNDLARDKFIWLEQLGIGYLECLPVNVYDEAYFEKYRLMRQSDMAVRLNGFRSGLAESYCDDRPVVDVGIGDGAFMEALEGLGIDALGYDINPAAIKWLRERGSWADLYTKRWAVVTFWDSLEHMRDPRPALYHVQETAIISIPIFESAEHALRSKHFRPDEHYWYFTEDGLEIFLARQGFTVTEVLDTETQLGREDIKTFVAQRAR